MCLSVLRLTLHYIILSILILDNVAGLVLCPTELIKCRLQAAKQMGQQDLGVISTVRCWTPRLESKAQMLSLCLSVTSLSK